MFRRIAVIASVVVIVGLLAGAATASAWGPREGTGAGYGGQGASGGHGFITVAAEEIGLTPAELVAELQDGKTIEQVALETGVVPEAIVETFVALRQEQLDQAVTNGGITQEQADERLALIEANATDHLTQAWPFAGASLQSRDCGGAYGLGQHDGYGSQGKGSMGRFGRIGR
ncbi:hypothetical protein ACFLX9_01760 [Chloroflexota bacterium]